MEAMLTDTHCHITCDQLFARIDEVLAQAKEHGIKRMLVICTNFIEYERAIELKAKGHPIDIALGFHPNDLLAFEEEDYLRLELLARDGNLAAIGEIGLDYHYDDVSKEIQAKGFITQMKIAKTYQLPIVIHMRDATKDTVGILKENGPCTGVLHCYSGSYETAKMVLELGYYISYGGPLTFKNSRGAIDVASQIPIDRLLIETDSPYLTPHPFRGRQNEPMYLTHTFKKLCEIKNIHENVLEKQLEDNYNVLFGKR